MVHLASFDSAAMLGRLFIKRPPNLRFEELLRRIQTIQRAQHSKRKSHTLFSEIEVAAVCLAATISLKLTNKRTSLEVYGHSILGMTMDSINRRMGSRLMCCSAVSDRPVAAIGVDL